MLRDKPAHHANTGTAMSNLLASLLEMGFATFGVLATCAFGALFLLRGQWLRWSATSAQEHDVAIGGAHAME
jgi:hypothetical protein